MALAKARLLKHDFPVHGVEVFLLTVRLALGYLSSSVHICLQVSSFCDENSPYKGAQRPQMCAIADDRARVAESGLKPPFGLCPMSQ